MENKKGIKKFETLTKEELAKVEGGICPIPITPVILWYKLSKWLMRK